MSLTTTSNGGLEKSTLNPVQHTILEGWDDVKRAAHSEKGQHIHGRRHWKGGAQYQKGQHKKFRAGN